MTSNLEAETKAVITNCGPSTVARVCVFNSDSNLFSKADKTYVLGVGETIFFTCESDICKLKIINASDSGCHYSTKVYSISDGASFVIREPKGSRDLVGAESDDC